MTKLTKLNYYKTLFDIVWTKFSSYDPLVTNLSKRYNINPKILKSIIVIEYINRGNSIYSILETFLAYFAPTIIITSDMSIGLCQIKLSRAKSVCKNISNNLLIKFLMSPAINIHFCARIIAKISQQSIEQIVLSYTTGSSITTSSNIILNYYIALCNYGLTHK